MSTIRNMIKTHPNGGGQTDALSRCAELCFSCTETCTACADACLSESQVEHLVRCIRLNLDCADICIATGRTVLRLGNGRAEATAQLLQACMIICRDCGAECERHGGEHEHCRICAEECRNCERACEEMAKQLGVAV